MNLVLDCLWCSCLFTFRQQHICGLPALLSVPFNDLGWFSHLPGGLKYFEWNFFHDLCTPLLACQILNHNFNIPKTTTGLCPIIFFHSHVSDRSQLNLNWMFFSMKFPSTSKILLKYIIDLCESGSNSDGNQVKGAGLLSYKADYLLLRIR